LAERWRGHWLFDEYGGTFERESKPLRGVYSCALCAASGAGAPPRKRGEERGQAKQKGRAEMS
jgi:hypothetical protein